MTDPPTRHIHKSAWRCQDEVRELLQAIFAAEMLAPSQCLWLVSPWISDIPVIDNRAGAFDALDSSWVPRALRLGEVITRSLQIGTTVVVATQPCRQPAVPGAVGVRGLRGQVTSSLLLNEAEDLHERDCLAATSTSAAQ